MTDQAPDPIAIAELFSQVMTQQKRSRKMLAAGWLEPTGEYRKGLPAYRITEAGRRYVKENFLPEEEWHDRRPSPRIDQHGRGIT